MYYERLTDVPGIKKIHPQRFVWHLSPRQNRSSILASGIDALKSEDKCVYANNQSHNIMFFYPFCVRSYYNSFSGNDVLDYDYWRIDTRKVNCVWFIDPNMENGPSDYMGSSRNFIITEASIPAEALTLYRIDYRFLTADVRFWVEYEEVHRGDFFKSLEDIPSDITVTDIEKVCFYDLSDIYLHEESGVVSVLAGLPLVKHELDQPVKLSKAA